MTAVAELVTDGPEQTLLAGRRLGAALQGGAFLALVGPLGAGKTQFTKGLALGLGIAEDEPIVSPTFVLIREYAGRLKLYHIDAYRLAGADELDDLGLAEMAADPEAVVAVEWADRVTAVIPPTALRLEFEHMDEQHRRITLHTPPECASLLVPFATGVRPLERDTTP